MTTTGPMAAIRVTTAEDRRATLDRMGAPRGGWHHPYATADAVIDTGGGVLYIACDPDPSPEDWEAVVGLILSVGFDNGVGPYREDPGAPGWDPIYGVNMWRLEYVPQAPACIWCDSKGTRQGCPVCGLDVLG